MNNKNSIQPVYYTDSVLEAELNAALVEISSEVSLGAETAGVRNLPEKHGDHYTTYYGVHHGRFQSLIDRINTKLQFRPTCQQVVDNDKATNTNVKSLYNAYGDARTKQNNFKNTTPPTLDLLRLCVVYAAVVIICLFDASMNMKAFEAWGMSYFGAICMAIVFAGVLMVFAHLFPKIINLGRTRLQRILIIVGLTSLTAWLFTLLANARIVYITEIAHRNGLDVSYDIWPFIVVPLFLLAVAVAITHFWMPTKAEVRELKAYRKLQKEKKDIDVEVSNIDAAIKAAQNENVEFRVTRGSAISYGESLEKRVITEAEKEYTVFKTRNLYYRTDGKPDCFDEPYPFMFNINFTINNIQHTS